jgi:hypothetical protein
MNTPEIVPEELRERAQWVCWETQPRDGKETKIPINPKTGQKAKTDDPATWQAFDEAAEYANEHDEIEGVGFVFSADDPFVGIDLDDCRDPETNEIDDWAQELIEKVDSYVEISPSGTGLHIILSGVIPGERNRRGDIEMYSELRYFTVTGRPVSSAGTTEGINNCQQALEHIYEKHLGGDEDNEPETEWVDSEYEGPDLEGAPEDDQELIERAKQAKNGPKFTQLWNGVTAGFDSHSEADMSLCNYLAFWTQKDPERMDRLFRLSGLMRDKWDEPRGDQTYGELTISKALAKVDDDDVYDPTYYKSDGQDGPSDNGHSPRTEEENNANSEQTRDPNPENVEEDGDVSPHPDEAKEVTEGASEADLREDASSNSCEAQDSNSQPTEQGDSTGQSGSDAGDFARPESQQTDDETEQDMGFEEWYKRELDYQGQVPPYVQTLAKFVRELENETDRNERKLSYWREKVEDLEKRVERLETVLEKNGIDVEELESEQPDDSNRQAVSESSDIPLLERLRNRFK